MMILKTIILNPNSSIISYLHQDTPRLDRATYDSDHYDYNGYGRDGFNRKGLDRNCYDRNGVYHYNERRIGPMPCSRKML